MSQKRVKQVRRILKQGVREIKRAGLEDVIVLSLPRRLRVVWRILTREGYSAEEVEQLRQQRAQRRRP